MSAYDDSLLAARFAALAPEPLAGNWDDVLRRAGVPLQDRQPLGRPGAREGPRRRFLVVLAVVAHCRCRRNRRRVRHSQLSSTRASSACRRRGRRQAVLRPVSWSLSAYGLGGGSRTHLWVYADGRLISQRQFESPGDALPGGANERSSGFLEQRLTGEGVERMRAEAISTGLFAHDSVLSVEDGPCFNLIEVSNGDRRVRVTWHGSQCPPLPGDPAATTATKEEESELLHLVARLTNPTTWLPASAWQERESRAYVPSRFAIDFGARPDTLEPSRILALLPDSAEELLTAKPRTRLRHFYGGAGVPLRRVYDYRSQVTVDEARTLAEALDGCGARAQAHSRAGVRADIRARRGADQRPPGAFFFVIFEPILPHGEAICSACG